MSNFKYVTAYWRDSREFFGDGSSAYTGTTFYMLNYTGEQAGIRIHFYDLDGKLYPDMEIDMLLPAGAVLDIRIADILRFKNPGMMSSTYIKTGSLSIVSSTSLSVSGKMYKGKTDSGISTDELTWSIPFSEVAMEVVEKTHISHRPQIPSTDMSEYFKKRRGPR